jgi:hypothetical protein
LPAPKNTTPASTRPSPNTWHLKDHDADDPARHGRALRAQIGSFNWAPRIFGVDA